MHDDKWFALEKGLEGMGDQDCEIGVQGHYLHMALRRVQEVVNEHPALLHHGNLGVLNFNIQQVMDMIVNPVSQHGQEYKDRMGEE